MSLSRVEASEVLITFLFASHLRFMVNVLGTALKGRVGVVSRVPLSALSFTSCCGIAMGLSVL